MLRNNRTRVRRHLPLVVLERISRYSVVAVTGAHGCARTYAAGDRVRLTRNVDRYPHFIAPAGATGVLTSCDNDLWAVRLDLKVDGAEDWDNEVQWYPDNCGDDARPDLMPA